MDGIEEESDTALTAAVHATEGITKVLDSHVNIRMDTLCRL
jgi:hypothetical protein